MKQRPYHQQGVAMLTAMLIVALAVVVVTSIFVQQRYSIRLNHNIQDMEQAYQYAYAAEKMAGAWLEKDQKETTDGQYDSLHDLWAQKLEPFEIDDDNGQAIGELQTQIEDMQAFFNVNNVYNAKDKKPRESMMKVFQQVLQDAAVPVSYAHSVLDWIDPDDLMSDADSAESDYYLSEDPAYRAGNAFLVDPSELRLIKMGSISDPKEKQPLLDALLPLVATLPTPTALNVNTATPETLAAIGLSSQQVSALMDLRKAGPIKDKTGFTSVVQGVPAEVTALLGVSSNYFRLSGQVKLGKSRLFLNSVLFRSPEGKVHVIMRQFTRSPKPAEPEKTG